jgi:hypothetical protein
MNKIRLILSGACLLALLTPLVALAQKKPDIFAQYNVSHTGVLQPDEIAAIRRDYAANPDGPLKKYDANHEGKLTDADIALIKPHKHKKSKDGDTASATHKKKKKSGDESAAPDASTAPAATDKPAAPTSTAPATPDKPAAPAATASPTTDSNGNK